MPFHMPKVNLNALPLFYQSIVEPLIDTKGNLITCPRFDCCDTIKLVHHYLLKFLYRLPGFSVPSYHSWYMPHVSRPISKMVDQLTEKIARDIIQHRCFGGVPYPLYLDDEKAYLCRDIDGNEFYLKIL